LQTLKDILSLLPDIEAEIAARLGVSKVEIIIDIDEGDFNESFQEITTD